jgi:hypothetical protein
MVGVVLVVGAAVALTALALADRRRRQRFGPTRGSCLRPLAA